MPAQKGRSFLLYYNINGVFQRIEGQRSMQLTVNNAAVDVSTKDTNNWRELLEGGGLSTMSISVSGIDEDAPFFNQLRTDLLNNAFAQYRIVLPNDDYFSCQFMISSLQQSGNHDDAFTYDLSIESSGIPSYTAV